MKTYTILTLLVSLIIGISPSIFAIKHTGMRGLIQAEARMRADTIINSIENGLLEFNNEDLEKIIQLNHIIDKIPDRTTMFNAQRDLISFHKTITATIEAKKQEFQQKGITPTPLPDNVQALLNQIVPDLDNEHYAAASDKVLTAESLLSIPLPPLPPAFKAFLEDSDIQKAVKEASLTNSEDELMKIKFDNILTLSEMKNLVGNFTQYIKKANILLEEKHNLLFVYLVNMMHHFSTMPNHPLNQISDVFLNTLKEEGVKALDMQDPKINTFYNNLYIHSQVHNEPLTQNFLKSINLKLSY